jgi:hypothetical protein
VPTDQQIEEGVLDYVRTAMVKGDSPTRAEAIRTVTGVLPVLPSQVAKALVRLVDAGKLGMRKDERLELKG